MKILYISLLALLFTFCSADCARAEQPQCIFQYYSTRDGLSHDRISDIHTDSRGFVWFCTWYGVSCFDGYTFRNYGVQPSDSPVLPSHRFVSMSEDSAGHLWFKTYNDQIYRFNRYTERFEDVMQANGLGKRHYRVRYCKHDDNGATWIALQGGGVVCFTSEANHSPVKVESLIDTTTLGGDVTALHIDKHCNTWIGTSGGNIKYISSGKRQTLHHLCTTRHPVFAFTDGEANVYCATRQEVVCADKSGKNPRIISYDDGGSDSTHFTAITADTTLQMVYLGDRKGNLYRLADRKIAKMSPHGTRLERIRDLTADSHGTLWITTAETGITRYNPALDNLKHFEQNPYTVSYNIDTLTRVVESGERVWIKMNRYGFGYYDRKNDSVEPFYNSPEQPNCQMTNAVIAFDVNEDVLWLSTYYERGLRKSQFLNQPASIFTLKSDISNTMSGNIRALMSDRKGSIWIGTRDGELVCYDHNLQQRIYEQSIPNAGMIYTIKEDSKGNIWVGTKGEGIFKLTDDGHGGYKTLHIAHSEDDLYSLNDNNVYCIEEDDGGRIWIATFGGGLNMLESHTSQRFIHSGNRLLHYPEEATRARWVTFDRHGRMLASTTEGIVIFDPDENPLDMDFRLVQQSGNDPESLSNNDVIQTMKDSRGNIWLATYGGGLDRIIGYDDDGEPRFRNYDTSHGLINNICMAITEDGQGDLWISTPNAVTRFDLPNEIFSNFPLYDDMRNADFSEATAATTDAGDVIFGSGRNIYRFNPESISQTKTDYKLRFTGLTVGNEPVVIGDDQPIQEAMSEATKIVLPYDYGNFRLQFASLNFAIQNTVRYMYRLEGYDQTWTMSGAFNRASYTNVPRGRYRFVVKAFVDTPSETGDEISVEIRILPPWWLTWWAKLIYVLLFAAIAYFLFKIIDSTLRIRRQASIEQNTTDMKLRFFTNISHELRTPLTLILGGIEDVQKNDRLSHRSENSLTLAHRNAKRMLSLINQLLDFRKIVKDNIELKISRVDLVPMVEDALDDFREIASERNLKLLFTVSQRSMPMWVDPERIESVIYNLLTNAVKFTPNGGSIETIITLNEADECALITVRDNGIGIPKDKINTIFERFAQASPSVDPTMKGSGIGLALSREIVLLHHGEITVKSQQGKGSEFTVKLRTGNAHFGMDQIDFAAGNCLVSDLSIENSVRRTDVQPPENAQKILLVEDNVELRIFMYNRLIESYHVIEADNGEEALEKTRNETPHIIITDYMMPRMDGIEFTNKVRKDFTISHIPIIMLTARYSPDNRMKALEYGADSYVTKPFDIEMLLVSIDNMLTQRRKLFEKFSSQSARNKIVELPVSDVVVTNRDEEFMKSIVSWLEENIENSDLTIDQLATHVGLGRTTMYNKIKSLTGKSPIELIKEYRLSKSRIYLHTGQFSVSEVAYKTGFSDPGYFSRCFREQFGKSPAEYLRSHNIKQSHESKPKTTINNLE